MKIFLFRCPGCLTTLQLRTKDQSDLYIVKCTTCKIEYEAKDIMDSKYFSIKPRTKPS